MSRFRFADRFTFSHARSRTRSRGLRAFQVSMMLLMLMSLPLAVTAAQTEAETTQAAAGQLTRIRVTDRTMRPLSPNLWSMNFSPNGFKTANQFFEVYDAEAIKRTGVKLLRFYGGCRGQFYDWRTPMLHSVMYRGTVHETHYINHHVMTINQALKVARTVDARLLFEINISTADGPADGCKTTPGFDSTVQDALDLLRTYPAIRFVELGNEPWFDWKPGEYVDRVLEFATAIRLEFPHVRIAAAGMPAKALVYDPSNTKAEHIANVWFKAARRIANAECDNGTAMVDCVDYLTTHQYGRTGYDPEVSEDWNFPGIGAFYPVANFELVLSRLRETQAQGRVAVTEWNMRCFGSESNRDNPALHTVEHAFYILESQLLMAKYNTKVSTLLGLSAPPGSPCSVVGTDGELNLVGRMMELTAPIAGGFNAPTTVTYSPLRIVQKDPSCMAVVLVSCIVEGQFPTVTSYSAYSRDRTKLFVYILNKSAEDQTVDLTMSFERTGLLSRDVTMKLLQSSSYTNRDFVETEGPLQLDTTNQGSTEIGIPARSIMRIEMPVNAHEG